MAHSIRTEDYEEPQYPTLLVISAWFGALLIGVTALGTGFGSPTEPSPTEPLIDLMQIGLIALILASFAFVFLRTDEGVRITAVPLFINIGTLVIIQLVPFSVLWEEVRFLIHFHQYEAIVQNVESGEWQADQSGMIPLPVGYRYLSEADGRLWTSQTVDGTAVFIATEQSGSNQFAGYFHHVNGRPPQSGEFQGKWQVIVPKKAGWYYCISR